MKNDDKLIQRHIIFDDDIQNTEYFEKINNISDSDSEKTGRAMKRKIVSTDSVDDDSDDSDHVKKPNKISIIKSRDNNESDDNDNLNKAMEKDNIKIDDISDEKSFSSETCKTLQTSEIRIGIHDKSEPFINSGDENNKNSDSSEREFHGKLKKKKILIDRSSDYNEDNEKKNINKIISSNEKIKKIRMRFISDLAHFDRLGGSNLKKYVESIKPLSNITIDINRFHFFFF